MARKNKATAPKAEKPVVIAEAAAEAEALKASGLGNMSEADLAAIRGAVADDPMTASEMLANGGLMPTEGQGFEDDAAAERPFGTATATELELAARVTTLEQEVIRLKGALEAWATEMNKRPALVASAATPVPIRPATADEQAAYTETNFALWQDGQKQHDGVQAWRLAGSPVLKAKPTKAGKAA